jgi:GntR family transcriptional regulator / MocR family aminotransferase
VSIQSGPVGRADELPLELERAGARPLHEQLELALREQIRQGRLAPGAKLPSSRALAAQLDISRGVVVEAYAQLTAEGYLLSSQGAPTRVALTASPERPPVPASSLEARRGYDLDPDLPDLVAFPRDQWLRSLRNSVRAAPFAALGEVDVRGTAALRNALMDYLSRVRGAAPEPEHTMVCAGFTHGFAALCRVLSARGIERIGLEEPGWPPHRVLAEAAGLTPVTVPVDRLGIDVSQLVQAECEVAVLTPAHQYPTGAVLAPERRAALLEWAEEGDALIVEDDYDSELRYDRVAVGALQGLAPERVCQIGSFGLRLAPGLRMGWILSPSWLTGALTYELGVAGGLPPTLDQLALCDFIVRGELDRHLRRMRAHYRSRRSALVDALQRHLPEVELRGIAAGTFVLASLPGPMDLHAFLGRAAERGVGVRPADSTGGVELALGYANLAEPAIERAIALLAQALVPREAQALVPR